MTGPALFQIGEDVAALGQIDPALIRLARTDVAHNDPPIGMANDRHISDVDEKPVFDHTRDLVQHQRQLPGVADPLQMQVQNEMPLIRP